MGVADMMHQITEGIEDIAMFAVIFVFGMIFIGEIYGIYTYRTISQGLQSPFYYPLYLAILLLVVRTIDEIFERK